MALVGMLKDNLRAVLEREVENRSNESSKDPSKVEDELNWIQKWFPEMQEWADERKKEGWELVSYDTMINDYGRGEWRGRPLETVLINATIKLKNRTIGEYHDYCFTFAFVNDIEFKFLRDQKVFYCNDTARVKSFEESVSFESQWVAK
jgi:hypothetical protein